MRVVVCLTLLLVLAGAAAPQGGVVSASSAGGVSRLEVSPVPLWPANGDTSLLPAGHSVFYSPATNEYVVTETDAATGNRAVELRVASHRSVDFGVDWVVTAGSQGGFVYSYTIANGPTGSQHIQQWSLETGDSKNTQGTHATWTSNNTSTLPAAMQGAATRPQGIKFYGRLSFISPPGSDLPQNQSASGFSVLSDLAPAFVWARAKGTPTQAEATPQAIASLPPEAATQLASCLSETWDSQSAIVLGPAMAKGVSGPEVEINYLVGIQRLERRRVLSQSSPTVQGTLSLLKSSTANDPSLVSAKSIDALSQAASPMELSILKALKLTLQYEGALAP